jgi:hypothetical protein
MELFTFANALLRQPTPELLWSLRAHLLAEPATTTSETGAALRDLVGEFYLYLSELRSKTSARDFNRLASLLDLTSVGILALEDVITLQEKMLEKLLLGGLAESLMVLGSFQYVKAWDREMSLLHERAAWFLYGALWQLSVATQPSSSATKRQEMIDALLAPLRRSDTPMPVKVALAGRVFQLIIVTYLTRLAAPKEPDRSTPSNTLPPEN